ncbi:DUF3370 family protein, partial [Microcoleus sp. F8-D1]
MPSNGTLGTQQVQAGKILARHPDTAYEAHGNYGVHYNLILPLHNTAQKPQTIAVSLETPLKEDKLSKNGLRFRQPPLDFPYQETGFKTPSFYDGFKFFKTFLNLL